MLQMRWFYHTGGNMGVINYRNIFNLAKYFDIAKDGYQCIYKNFYKRTGIHISHMNKLRFFKTNHQ